MWSGYFVVYLISVGNWVLYGDEVIVEYGESLLWRVLVWSWICDFGWIYSVCKWLGLEIIIVFDFWLGGVWCVLMCVWDDYFDGVVLREN